MRYRGSLPQLAGDRPFVTDGGLETTLIFHRGIDLPHFASFDLLRTAVGEHALREYYDPYLAVAREHGAGFVLDTATWRANPDWGALLGYSPQSLDDANRAAVDLVAEIRAAAELQGDAPIVLSGAIGPRGDGYSAGEMMSATDAERYHRVQLTTFADTALDMATVYTMTYVDEAVGIARAARSVGLPVAISFTVETDGRLPSGQPLREAIEQVDAETDGAPAYFMINCAHPSHFAAVLDDGGEWLRRVGGLRANSSPKSHAELDDSEELDEGDPIALGVAHRELRQLLPDVKVVGGCCGTDHRHVAQIRSAWDD